MSRKRYLRVRNFDALQHYKDRNPIWIKIYCSILEDYDFARLPDETKFHAVGLMLLASRSNNKFPDDERWLRAKINAEKEINLDLLLEIRFLEVVKDEKGVENDENSDGKRTTLNLMRDTEVCVCFFVEVIGTNQPKISRHLAYLRKAGIVAARRDGIWAHYRIIMPKNENAARILRDVQEWLKTDKVMQKDRKQLANVCCALQPPATIQGAPRPASVLGSL